MTIDRDWEDEGTRLPRRFPLRVWVFATLAFVASYAFLWCYIHVLADMRPCQFRLSDPLFALIPYHRAWYLISKHVYTVATISAVVALFVQAARGDQRPILRWGTALTVQALLRSVTIYLIPLCRFTRAPGSIVLTDIPTLNLGFARIPWRVWATNDLVFSGHVGEFLLLYWATRTWPRPVRVALLLFQVLQVFALLGTRGHYTIDIFLALPCAFFADAVAVRALTLLGRPSSSPTPEQS